MKQPSVRARVTTVAALAVAVVLAVAGFVTVATVQDQLVQDLDDTAGVVADRLEGDLDGGPLPDPLSVSGGDDDTFAQVLDTNGDVRAATPNVAGAPAVVTSAGLSTRRGLPHESDRFRVLARPLDDGLLVVGVTLDDVDESVAALRGTLLIISPLVLVVLAALVWVVVGRTLRPVEEANQRQRQFVADASHELRSPLTRIRAELEVDLAHRAAAEPWETHRRVLADAVALQALVDDLLLLARQDSGHHEMARTAVDLDDLVFAEVASASPGHDVAIDVSKVSAGQVLGDADQLRRVVRNLLDNAIRHARTTVSITLHEEDDDVELAVTDDGPGIPVDARQQVFERFARLDDARSATGGGTGLGLAITRDIVEAHGGTVVVDPEQPTGTRMVVRLPRLR